RDARDRSPRASRPAARELAGGPPMIRGKAGAATLSIASNSALIALKIAAGAITGSIAIITEAAHSSIDLLASVIALVSVRKADEPPDPEHPYGHEKVENVAAAVEGMLVLVGAGIIGFEATRRRVVGAPSLTATSTFTSSFAPGRRSRTRTRWPMSFATRSRPRSRARRS